MKNVTYLLFSLLCNALYGREIPEDEKIEIKNRLPDIYCLSKSHDVAHLAAYALKKSGIDAGDDEVAKKLSKQQLIAVLRYERLKYESDNLCNLLEKAKIPFIPLKGAVIREIYPEPWMRTSCDIDLLVPEEKLNEAVSEICASLGYNSKGERDYHDISLYSESGVHLELHFNIKENMENIDRLLEKVWDYAYPADGAYRYKLSPEYLIFHITAHMSYHFMRGGCGIRSFVDLHMLRNKISYNEEKLRQLLGKCGIEKFYDNAVRLCSVWLDKKDHDEITLAMEDYLISGGAYGSVENTVSVEQSKSGSKLRYFAERIFMPYEGLLVRYPELEGRKYLVPFYQLKRWYRILFKGGMKRTADQFGKGKSISDDKVRKTETLLKNIGLM